MPTLTNNEKLPGNVNPATVTATVELWGAGEPVTGYMAAADATIGGPRIATGNPWTITDLIGNADPGLLPAGTVYRALRSWPGLRTPLVDFIAMPSSGGPYSISDIPADPPASLPSAALSSHAADVTLHGNGRRLWVARKTDATFATAVTSPLVVPGWSRSDTVPAGDWMVEASAEAFADAAANGGTLGLWVDLPITAISRTGNVVTATIPVGHGVQVGADVLADVTDNTFDGRFLITAVTATTVQWAQTAANDPDGGTGTLSIRLGVNASFRNTGTIRALAHVPDAWWAPTAGLAYTMQPRFNASVGTVTLLAGPFFGLPGQGVMTAETR